MAEVDYKELTQEAYNCFAAHMDYKNVDGSPMQALSDIPLEHQRAWEEAVKCVVQMHDVSKNPPDEQPSRFAQKSDVIDEVQYQPYADAVRE